MPEKHDKYPTVFEQTRFVATAFMPDRTHGIEFMALIVQDHPEIFAKTIRRVMDNNFEPLPVELPSPLDRDLSGDLNAYPALIPEPETVSPNPYSYVQNGHTAKLTYHQFEQLQAVTGSQIRKAEKMLKEFDPGFVDRNLGGGEYAAFYWCKELPNIKNYGC